MSNHKSRLAKLEKNRPEPAPSISDDSRMARMKQLAEAIATEARAQGMTAQDNPRLLLPLAIVEAIA